MAETKQDTNNCTEDDNEARKECCKLLEKTECFRKLKEQVLKDLPPKCWKLPLTEFEANYGAPQVRKPLVTRAKCLEQFWWHELYEEYLKYFQKIKIKFDPITTEYRHEYKLDFERENLEELINKYPIYITPTITVWNETGDKEFKYKRSITQPTHLSSEQFG